MTEKKTVMTSSAAIFDMDRTLTRHDTLLPWLRHLVGPRKAALSALRAAPGALNPVRSGGLTHRHHVKAKLLGMTIAGHSEASLVEAARRLSRDLEWIDETCRLLEDHLDEGHRVLVATGALSLVARTLINERFGSYPTNRLEVIGTEIEYSVENAYFTGRMTSLNCIGHAKAARVMDWLNRHGPFENISGYGNAPHDLPMLNLCDKPHIIKRGQILIVQQAPLLQTTRLRQERME